MKDVVLLTGAGQIGMAIVRRVAHGKKIIVGDKRLENAEMVAAAYKNLLPDYRCAFSTIEFAVFCRDFETQNYDVFAAALGQF